MSRIYARALTKDYLVKHGVKEITEDCKVIFYNGRVLSKEEDFTKNTQGYLTFTVLDLDENGNRIKRPVKRRSKYTEKIYNTYIYKVRTICLHRAMWAWFNNEVPEGLVIDHISNKHYTLADNKLENLQLLTPRANLVKERNNIDIRELKCKMTLPLSYYEEKLITFISKYNDSKDQEEKHLLRAHMSNYRARIRYWKSHEEEYIKAEETKAIEANALKTQKARTKELKQYKKIIYEARELYKQDPSSDNNYNWRLAVDNYNEFVKNNPFKTQKQLFAELDSDNKRN